MTITARPYCIEVAGQLNAVLHRPALAQCACQVLADTTRIHTPELDQAALFGLLRQLRDLGLTLLSLNPLSATSTQPVNREDNP
ncbi:hypothetical protein [Oceanobacter mangrovi]|uniref:hypothetical protein n=1 Tax=Oceanobacter mangrovi TaxID=2862510 RepID=UPI001C8ECB69|nr:hypothetical protein [Oceanobacter mangrovi]